MGNNLVITHNTLFSLITNETRILDRIDIKALTLVKLHAPAQLKRNVTDLISERKCKLDSKQKKLFEKILQQLIIHQESKTVTNLSDVNIIEPYKEIFEQVDALGIWDDHYRYNFGLNPTPYYETNDVNIILNELKKLATREENYFVISPEIVYELVINKNGLWDHIGLEHLKNLRLFAPNQLFVLTSELLEKNKIKHNSESQLRLNFLKDKIVLIDPNSAGEVANKKESSLELSIKVDKRIKTQGIWISDETKIQESKVKSFTTNEIIAFIKKREKLEKIVALNKFEIVITNETLAKIIEDEIEVNIDLLKDLRIFAPTTIIEQTLVIIERNSSENVDVKQIREKIENIIEKAILVPIENEKSALEGYKRDFLDYRDDIEIIYELLFEKIKAYGVWDNSSYESLGKDMIPFSSNHEVFGLIKELDEIRNIVDNGITQPIEKKPLIPTACDLKGIWLTEKEWLDKKAKGMYSIQYVYNFLYYEGLLNLQDSEIYYFSGINNNTKNETMFDLVPDYTKGYGIKPSDERSYLPIFNEKNVTEIEIWCFEHPEEYKSQYTGAHIYKFEIPPSEIKFMWQLFLDLKSSGKNNDNKSTSFKDLNFEYMWHLSEDIYICFAADVKAEMKDNFEDGDIQILDEEEVRQHLNISKFLDSQFFIEKNTVIKIGKQSFIASELSNYYIHPFGGAIKTLEKKEQYNFKEKLRLAPPPEKITKDLPKELEEPETVTICEQKVKLDSTTLNLSHRYISELPSTIGKFVKLEILELAKSELTDLPDELKLLKNLREINLYDSGLDKFPKILCSLTQLEKIILDGCEIKELPPEIKNLHNLRYLDLGNNELETLPTEICMLANLKELILNDNNLEALPEGIGKLANLENIHLPFNKLKSLPASIGNLTKLTKLELYKNQLTTLPSEIGNLANLESIRASSNQIASLPPEIGNLNNLSYFSMERNNLTSLPPEFGKLEKLDHIFLNENKLTSIPAEIGRLKNLTALMLEKNKLKTIPKEIGLLKLHYISLHDNELTEIPAEFFLISSLTRVSSWPSSARPKNKLILSNNKLTKLPPEFGYLKQYEIIEINNNKLTTLPSEISNLQTKILYLNNNNLTSLPKEIGQIKGLEDLELNNNSLVSLPEEIGSLSSLKYLEINNNKLIALPPKMGLLNNLEIIDLEENKLTEIPSELSSLPKLREFNLSKNLIKEIPSEFAAMLNLRELDIRNNKLKIIPDEFAFPDKSKKFRFDDYLLENAPPRLNTTIKINDYYCGTADLDELDFYYKSKESIIQFSKVARHCYNLRKLSLEMGRFKEDIDENDLREIEKAFAKIFSSLGMYTPLEELNIYSLGITLPDELGCLVNLKELFIRGGKFDIPSTIGKLTNLEKLTFEDTDIKSLPAEIGDLSNLEKLKLRETELKRLPAEIGKLSNLKEMNLRTKYICNLPIEFGQLKNLEDLAISLYSTNEYKLKIPDEFRNLENLRKLRINEGFAGSLPKAICFLKNLVNLELRDNKLVTLPSEIQNLMNLEELDCTKNKLATLPEGVGALTKLRKLILEKNNLSILPAGLGGLTSLVSLELNSNNLTSFPPEIGKLENLREISCCYNQLTSLPDEFNNLVNLKRASLYKNQIAKLPSKIGNLQKLERLFLSDNQITSLPSDLGDLKKLAVLDCTTNQLVALPLSFGKLSNLVKIKCNENRIKSLPHGLGQLANLETLSMNSNELIELPLEIGLLENLEIMSFYKNKIQKIPSTISNLKKLKTINFGRNQLTDLPIELSKLPELKKLDIAGNPIVSISKEINPLVIIFREKNVTNSEELLNSYYSILQERSKPKYIEQYDYHYSYSILENTLEKSQELAMEFAKINNFEKSLEVMAIVEQMHSWMNYYQYHKLKSSWKTYYNIANFSKEQEFYEKAFIFVDKGISLSKLVENCSEEEKSRILFDFKMLTGDIHTKKGDLKKALETYEESLKIIKSTNKEDQINEALQQIAITHARLAEFKKAFECFHLVPLEYSNYKLLYDEGLEEKAYEYLLEEQKLHPKNSNVFYGLACNASQTKKDKSIILDYLSKVIIYGDWWDCQRIHKNKLFDNIRDLPEFDKMFDDSLKNRNKN